MSRNKTQTSRNINTNPGFHNLIVTTRFRATHVIHHSQWVNFSQLTSLPHLTDMGFWRTMQLSHFLRSFAVAAAASDHQRPLMLFEEDCTQTGPTSHNISRMYAALLSFFTDTQLSFWSKWERDLDCVFSGAEMDKITQIVHKYSPCMRLQESGCKLLAR